MDKRTRYFLYLFEWIKEHSRNEFKGMEPASYQEWVDCEYKETELELTDEQVARIDEIYNAVYEMCKVIAGDETLEWDMHYIGEITELAANMMVNRGYKVWFPAIVTEEDGCQHIEEYYEPEGEEM